MKLHSVCVLATLMTCNITLASEITWKDLWSVKFEDKTKKTKTLIPKKVAAKLDEKANISGYMFALDWSKDKVGEFLLMPYYPSCMHVPMPPANQTILVKLKKAIPISYAPIKVFGKVEIEKYKDVASFTMDATSVKEYRR